MHYNLAPSAEVSREHLGSPENSFHLGATVKTLRLEQGRQSAPLHGKCSADFFSVCRITEIVR